MGFNIKKFREAVEKSTVNQANRAVKSAESLWLGRLDEAVERMINIARNLMVFRTWNYASSIVGILFYNGKILGVETDGYSFSQRVYKKDGYIVYSRMKDNPNFGYQHTGRGDKPWRYSSNMNYHTGKEFAHYAVEEAKKNLQDREGYAIMLVVGMPYATVKRGNPPMYERTMRIFENALMSLGTKGSKLGAISIDLGDVRYKDLIQ